MKPEPSRDSREFARIPVKLRARFRILEETEVDRVGREILRDPTVWTPADENALLGLATSPHSDSESTLARSLLEVVDQVRRLSYRVLASGRPMETARIVQLSGSGCRMSTSLLLDLGTRLEVQLEDDEYGAPPVRLVGEIVHAEGPQQGRYGLRFNCIHPTDQERLIRFVYQIQRKELRRVHMRNS